MARRTERENLAEGEELIERVVDISRVAKVVKGGRRFAFRALVVVGDGNGRVGVGVGKAREVPAAIQKAPNEPRNMVPVRSMVDASARGVGELWSDTVLMKPASGTGVVADGDVRAVLELPG